MVADNPRFPPPRRPLRPPPQEIDKRRALLNLSQAVMHLDGHRESDGFTFARDDVYALAWVLGRDPEWPPLPPAPPAESGPVVRFVVSTLAGAAAGLVTALLMRAC